MANSVLRRVFLGIRLISVAIVLGITYYDYKHEGMLGIFGNLAMFGVMAGLNYSSFQGNKLAEENMKKYGLEPDRDEAPPSA